MAGERRVVVMARPIPFAAHERPGPVRRSRSRPPRRPQPAGEAQRVPRRAGARHRRGAAGGGRRPGRPLRRRPRQRPDVLVGHGPRRAGRASRRRRSGCGPSAAPAWRRGTSPRRCPSPSSAQIQGACIGGALELALACDFRVLAADAIVGLPETRIGLIPDVGGSSRLPQVVGLGRAKELIMTGKLIGAEEAERIGLANRVAPGRGARRRGRAARGRAAGLRADRGRRSPSG